MVTLLRYNTEKNNSLWLIRDFYILLMVTLVVFILAPKSLAILFLGFTLVVYYISNNDSFWLAYAITITTDIGGIFLDHSIQLLSISQFHISYLSLFSIVSFFKFLISKRSYSLAFIKKYYIIYGFLFILLLVYGLLSFGLIGGGESGLRYMVIFFQSLLYLPLLYTIPKCLNHFNKLVIFSSLLISIIPLNILGQLFYLKYGASFYEIFISNTSIIQTDSIYNSRNILRPEFGSTIRYFSFIMALFLYQVSGYFIPLMKKNVYLIFAFLIYFSNLITATRGWIISFSIIFIIISILEFGKSRIFLSSLLFVFLILGALQFNDVFRLQIQNSVKRLFTIEAIIEGDQNEIESTARLTVRHEEVMKIFKEFPLFGAGISSLGLDKFDQHTGNQSILATGGIIEFLIYLYLILNSIIKILFINSLLSTKNIFKNKITYFIIFLIGILIIHSTSSFKFGIVGWFKYSGSIVFIILFYTLFNQILMEALHSNKSFVHEK